MAAYICHLSRELNRQIALLIDRRGKVLYVIVGSDKEIVIPRLSDFRVAPSRLRGLRCVHTHLRGEALTEDDLTDLVVLRLDLMAAIEVTREGRPGKVYGAHLFPGHRQGQLWNALPPQHMSHLQLECTELIQSVERDLSHHYSEEAVTDRKRAIIVSVTSQSKWAANESVAELKELARTNFIEPLETVLLRPHQKGSKYLVGQGQLNSLTIKALSRGADTLLFNQELKAAQANALSEETDLFVMDRNQLILEIFGRRALSRDGKSRVELAQLKYALPRLSSKDDALSRIRGGIGLRGPGETKMEIGKRRIQDRISSLEKELSTQSIRRKLAKNQRLKSGLPLISIIGYTNAGKSTLLNLLTQSEALAENRLFATLDPTTRRLYLPGGGQAIISDTVGFIRDLPPPLLDAFRSTLEEIGDATLLLHLADMSNPNLAEQIKTVDEILVQLEFHRIPRIVVFNKRDKVDRETEENLCRRYSALAVSSLAKENIDTLLKKIKELLEESTKKNLASIE